ncbi:MAG: HAD family phosphatase [Acidaminococcaceae bacterium]|nr:HAD family phosphatase [Acidaminococcaceae bacterium]
MEKQVQAVIFDMDGVIFDSERLVIECWKVIAEKHNIPDIVEICMRVQGNNRVETGKRFLEKYGNDFPYETYKKEVTALFRERYGEGRLPLKPGVVEILHALQKAGIPLAVASSTRSDIVRIELEEAHLLQYFDAILGGDMVSRSKPEPDIFLAAAKALQADPAGCYVLEDSHNGIRAASRAGMHPIMVPDMQQPTEEMHELAEVIKEHLPAALVYLQAKMREASAK